MKLAQEQSSSESLQRPGLDAALVITFVFVDDSSPFSGNQDTGRLRRKDARLDKSLVRAAVTWCDWRQMSSFWPVAGKGNLTGGHRNSSDSSFTPELLPVDGRRSPNEEPWSALAL